MRFDKFKNFTYYITLQGISDFQSHLLNPYFVADLM